MSPSEMKNLADLKLKVEQLNLTTSHTKRSTIENGKSIGKVLKMQEAFHDEWILLMAQLTGDKGYLKQTTENGKKIEAMGDTIDVMDIRMSKQDIKLIKILVFGITAGLIMGWLWSQYQYKSKEDHGVAQFYRETEEEAPKIVWEI